MNKVIEGLQQKEMDRKEFLQFMGVALLMFTGIAGFLKSLQRLHDGDSSLFKGNKAGRGYGSNTYGKGF